MSEKKLISHFRLLIWNDNFQYKNSVLYKFGKFVAKSQTNSPLFLKYAFKGFLDTKTQVLHEDHNFKDLMMMFTHLPGYVYIKYIDVMPEGHQDLNYIEINGIQKVLISIVWIMPWINTVIRQIDYLEIDASFYACAPYKYCIYHSITYNNSIPIALSLHPTESSELYNMIFEGMLKHKLDY